MNLSSHYTVWDNTTQNKEESKGRLEFLIIATTEEYILTKTNNKEGSYDLRNLNVNLN